MTTVRSLPTRPAGVTALAVLAIVIGSLAILIGILLVAAGAIVGALGLSQGAAEAGVLGLFGMLGAVAGIGVLVYAAFAFAVAYGLFRRHRWAWYASIVIVGIQILGGLGSLIGGDILSALVGLLLGAIVGWYLLSPPVQAWFGVSYRVPWEYKPARPA